MPRLRWRSWSRKQRRSGFDGIFCDVLHMFLKYLFKESLHKVHAAQIQNSWPVYFADLCRLVRQGPILYWGQLQLHFCCKLLHGSRWQCRPNLYQGWWPRVRRLRSSVNWSQLIMLSRSSCSSPLRVGWFTGLHCVYECIWSIRTIYCNTSFTYISMYIYIYRCARRKEIR